MTRWRQKVKAEGMEKLLEVTVKTGLKTGALKRAELKKAFGGHYGSGKGD